MVNAPVPTRGNVNACTYLDQAIKDQNDIFLLCLYQVCIVAGGRVCHTNKFYKVKKYTGCQLAVMLRQGRGTGRGLDWIWDRK